MYLQLHIYLAADAVSKNLPLYKVRPKHHQFFCELLRGLKLGNKLNARYVSCWGDEGHIGDITLTVRGPHPKLLALRTMQRVILELNRGLLENGN